MSDALQLDEMDCLLCLLAGHEEVRFYWTLNPRDFHHTNKATVLRLKVPHGTGVL